MFAQSAVRAARIGTIAPRRAFHASSPLKGGFHYPEGPRSNLPFNPQAKGFAFKYILFTSVGLGVPFAIAVYQTYKNQ